MKISMDTHDWGKAIITIDDNSITIDVVENGTWPFLVACLVELYRHVYKQLNTASKEQELMFSDVNHVRRYVVDDRTVLLCEEPCAGCSVISMPVLGSMHWSHADFHTLMTSVPFDDNDEYLPLCSHSMSGPEATFAVIQP